MDVYASLLYVKNMGDELRQLAGPFLEKEELAPEACCIVGQHYAFEQNHKKVLSSLCDFNQRCIQAIEYFEKAVQLDDAYSSARLFMAQEYIELGDYPAALSLCRCQRAFYSRDGV